MKPGEFPDCFYFDTDPVTYSTTVALRNQSRVADMEKYVGVLGAICVCVHGARVRVHVCVELCRSSN